MSRFLNRSLGALTPYVPGEQPRGEVRLIKLNTNESPFPPSPLVLDALSRAEAEKLRLYPDPTCRAAAEAIAREVGVSPAQVVLGNGSDELLAFAFHGFFCEWFFHQCIPDFTEVNFAIVKRDRLLDL